MQSTQTWQLSKHTRTNNRTTRWLDPRKGYIGSSSQDEFSYPPSSKGWGGGVGTYTNTLIFPHFKIFASHSIFFETFSANKVFVQISLILRNVLLYFRKTSVYELNDYYMNPKMETREKSSYLKMDQLHTSLSNKESSSHWLRHRHNQQIPPTTKNSLINMSRSHRPFRIPTGTRDPGLRHSKCH